MTSLRETLAVCGLPELLALYERIHPRTYQEFVFRIYDDLDACVGQLESDAKDFDAASEDSVSRAIVRLLAGRCHHASHDHDEGGHVDIRIGSRDGRFSWLAEAKIYRSNSNLDKGMDQLIDRYAKGTAGHNRGGLLIYVQAERCAERLAGWKKYHEGQTAKYEELETSLCIARQGLSFFSAFVLPRLGKGAAKYEVRHMAVSLYRRGVTTAKPRKQSAPKQLKP